MKKSILSLIVGAGLLIAPLTASALSPMSADSLKDATGQAGVSIAIDNVKLESWVGETKYTDLDGVTKQTSDAASVVIGDKHTVKELYAITDGTLTTRKMDDGTGTMVAQTVTIAGGTHFEAKALSIDVGTCDALTKGMSYNRSLLGQSAVTVAGVVIGLPTLEISTTADTYTVGIERTGAANSGAKFIQINKGASTLAILGGTVEIAPH